MERKRTPSVFFEQLGQVTKMRVLFTPFVDGSSIHAISGTFFVNKLSNQVNIKLLDRSARL